jgi:hypothetical protein
MRAREGEIGKGMDNYRRWLMGFMMFKVFQNENVHFGSLTSEFQCPQILAGLARIVFPE